MGGIEPLIVRLDALNGAGESFYKVFHKEGGGISAVLLKGFHKAPPGILIYGGTLEELLPDHPAVDKAGGGDEFYIHLDTLSGMVHLFIGFGDILGVRGMESPIIPCFFRKRYNPGMERE